MIIDQTNLDAAFLAFKMLFQGALTASPTTYSRIVTEVSSSTKEEKYPWLGTTTRFREWVGARRIQNLQTHGFTIVNKKFENTIGIKRDEFEDDSYGIYSPIIQQMGQDSANHPDILVYNLLKAGDSTPCYDGQNFFDTDHPGFDANGADISVSNYQAGSGPAWVVMDVSKVVKPIILQKRRPYNFVARTKPDDPRVFDMDEYLYGVDARLNVGFGLWQFAFMSKAPLTADNYKAARAAMGSLRGENGDSIGVMPNLLIVPPSLEGDANTLLKADYISATSNVWKGTAEMLVSSRFA
ncbi:Mu-like prophage major head subunit gpT [Nitrospirillum viridazoti Y2]|uniref:Phage major head subunit gpT-like protein n=1 Tax=Nitrospirillum amazonense TaxID=28077 RepID=A0A560II65_9PROT|nr:Mu-like prophage major head subunit gpT family protein [Nitrospirillum amazonense]EGY02284.1 Mu-like prophage major head subunit gpT [Nitrospirillum amazonense Y2]TWB58686.1 phage major head subunit gpT-like protein [Nitrospirillum amazonense]